MFSRLGNLARCWIQPALLKDLENDAHACLLEMGLILPPELNIHVVKTNKNRPRLVVYETINGCLLYTSDAADD